MKNGVLVLIFLLGIFWGWQKITIPKISEATLGSCSASVSPNSVKTYESLNFNFSLTNTDSNPILYIKVTTPSSNFSIMGANINGWTTNRSSSFAEFYGGSVNPGETINFVIQVSTGANESPTANWKVEANDVMSSGGVTSCGGSLGTEISGMTDVEAPIISDLITISEVTSTSVKISWTTNEVATSEIFYSANDAYDLEKKDLTLKTNHGLTLDGLTVNTSYYFYVVSTDGGGNSSSSNFASFTTAVTNSNVGTTQTIVVTTTTTTSSPTPTSRPLVDTVAPVVNISTDFSKPFKIAPTINGKAIDGGAVNVGVVGVEYSLDNGKNWLPVDSIDNVGKKSVSFEFTPVGLDDGNYLIKMRAKDSTGNVGLSKTYTMVIDRLPPQVGGSLFTLGPMILKPDSSGNIYSIAGMEIKVILSAVGGPINMDLFFDLDKFSLVKNEESGLWSGLINTGKIGTFQLVTKSIDGAKNETERKLSKIVALKAGKIVDENNKAISKARIKIYTFEKSQNDFTLWESEPYMQTNPQESDENGEYRLILPPGKYYLEIEVRGKRKLRSEIFELQTATPINQDFNLEKALFWGNWWAKTVSMNIVSSQEVNSNEVKNDLVGKMIPDFDLSNQNSEFSSTSVLGKPSVMTFISSWEPQSSDQLLELDQFKSENDGVNVAAVVTQESVSKVDIFKKVGGYKIPIIADPDGILVVPLNLESLPTHIFLDRKGMIKDMYVGFLNKDSLLKRILN